MYHEVGGVGFYDGASTGFAYYVALQAFIRCVIGTEVILKEYHITTELR